MSWGGEAAANEAEMLVETHPVQASTAQAALTVERAFTDLEGMLHSIAAAPSHYRNFAVHYLRCREALLASDSRSSLPGFLVQCGTSDKFREFITLYDPSVQARKAFIDEALAGCRAKFGWARPYDIFDDDDF